MRRFSLGAILSIFLLSTGFAADVESAKSALETFGLLGTWALACEHPGNETETYNAPLVGPPTMTRERFSSREHRVNIDTITSATRVTDEKIKIVSFSVRREHHIRR